MKLARFEAIFENLSTQLIRYQPGDIMAISDIGDSIAELARLSPLPELTAGAFTRIIQLIEQEMRGGETAGFMKTLGDGLDLLHAVFQEAPNSLQRKQPMPDYLLDALAGFVRSIDPLPEAPAESGNTQPGTGGRQAEDAAAARDAHQRGVMVIFIHDARERLDQAQAQVLDLESLPEPSLALNELFRVFHTFKGETGFLHLPHLGELAHHYENILDHLRNQRIGLGPDIIDLLLEGIDTARLIIDRLERHPGDEGSEDAVRELVGRIAGLLHGHAEPLGSRLIRQGVVSPAEVDHALSRQKETGFIHKLGEVLVNEGMASRESVHAAVQEHLTSQPVTEAPASPAAQPAERPTGAESLVKVRAGQIQYMVDMLGELVISLNQLDDDDRRVQASRKIAKNLQLAAMQVGTVGIGSLFSNMRRVVREASRQLDKDAELVTVGNDLEVDRNLVDKLGEPLMHLLRNAIGHGIEDAAGRAAAGKPPKGRIELSAGRTGHNVVIRVRDDGRGLDQERIRSKAMEKGLISGDRAAVMTRPEILDLIFLPGFSTAEAVDAISGRGVGMDVVKTMVEQMRGRLGLESVPGEFTEVSLTFPINMAIIDGMIVQLGSRLFIIPVSVIIESLELDPASFREVASGVRVCSIRGETMPVIDLGTWFGLDRLEMLERSMAVVVEARGGKYALIVHDIVAKKEVVIKSLGRLFAQTRGIASGTILQGGRIGLVLDVDQIVRTE